MSEFRTFDGGESRPPTWAERERMELLRTDGVDEVNVEPDDAVELWEALLVTIGPPLGYRRKDAVSTEMSPTLKAMVDERSLIAPQMICSRSAVRRRRGASMLVIALA